MSGLQLSPFEVGQIKAHMEHGLGPAAIAKRIMKADGKTTYSETAISNAMDKLEDDPLWKGQRCPGSARPRKTTPKQDRLVVKWVLKKRGEQKVSCSALKKQFPFLRRLSDTLVEERLHEAHLEYLRRRRKTIVTVEYLAERVSYAHAVKRKHQATLEKWAYTDGTVYYLDRTSSEHANTVRNSLGSHVWRRSDNTDALYEDCIGPSSYNKGQGIPIRVWGMLACGVLHIHILDEGEVMDTILYVELIEDFFEDWCGNSEQLVCDFERCLRTGEAVRALGQVGLTLVEGYPRSSQDFNAIENAWAIVKQRLDVTVPVQMESREEFVTRLKSAVKWVNQNRSHQLWSLSTNQKERATACLASKPPGGRTRW